MPNKKLNPKLLWIQFEDILVPRLGLTVWDRAVYSYLLRHSLGHRQASPALRGDVRGPRSASLQCPGAPSRTPPR